MRDPRSGFAGFAKRFFSYDPSSPGARSLSPILGALLCCACGGVAASASNGTAAAPAPAAVPSAAIAPEVPGEPRAHPLRYSAPESCPGVDGYLGDVEFRARSLQLDASSAPPETDATWADAEGVDVRVEAAPDARGWRGHVTIAGPRALEREVRGERCEDVVAALALITVLRLESTDADERGAASGVASGAGASGASEAGASASGAAAANAAPSDAASAATEPGPEQRSPAAGAPSPASGQSSTSAAPAPSAASPPPPPEGARPATPEDGEAASAAEPSTDAPDESSGPPRGDDEGPVARGSSSSEPDLPESIARESTGSETAPSGDTVALDGAEQAGASGSWPSTRFGVSALGGYATVPSHAFRAALEGELRLGEGTSAWLTSLSFAYARGDHSRAPSDLALTLLTLELALCPPSFVAEPSLWISGCASVRAGRVHLAYTATEPGVAANDRWRPWLAVGPSLRVGVPLSERWALRGVAELAVQLVRDTYSVGLGAPGDDAAESLPLYSPEALSLELGAGIGYSF